MPGIRGNVSQWAHARFNIPNRHASSFNAQIAALKPFLWIRADDVPGSGSLLDYGNQVGTIVYPQGPPHNLPYPSHSTQIAPAFTTDGKPGMQWDGSNAQQAAWTGSALDDQPQGTNWTILVAAQFPNGMSAYQIVYSMCAGTGLDTDGKALFTMFQAGAGAGTAVFQTYYNGGSFGAHTSTDPRFTDGNWHLYGLNVHSPGASPQSVMDYDLYIDGALADSFTIDSNGISFWSNGAGVAALPDAYRIGGTPGFLPRNNRSLGCMQHFVLFIGGAYTQFGGMLTANQHAALYAGR